MTPEAPPDGLLRTSSAIDLDEADADPESLMADAIAALVELHNDLAMVWPARIDGQLRRPPDDHILDQLVRTYLLIDESIELLVEIEQHPAADTISMAPSGLPPCDLCSLNQRRDPPAARYDAPVVVDPEQRPVWAFLCPCCFSLHTPQRLGASHGRYILTWEEVPDAVRDRFHRARTYWRSRGVDVSNHAPWDWD